MAHPTPHQTTSEPTLLVQTFPPQQRKQQQQQQRQSQNPRAQSAPKLNVPARLKLHTLPDDVLLHVCDFVSPHALLSLSLASPFWSAFCMSQVWPRRIASCLGVRYVRFQDPHQHKRQHRQHPPPPPPPSVQERPEAESPRYFYRRRPYHVVESASTHFLSPSSGTEKEKEKDAALFPPDPNTYFRILHTFMTCPSARTLCVCVTLAPTDNLTSLALHYAVSRHDICAANSLYAEHHVAARRHLYIPLPTDDHVRRITGKPQCALTPLLVRDNALSNKLFPIVLLK